MAALEEKQCSLRNHVPYTKWTLDTYGESCVNHEIIKPGIGINFMKAIAMEGYLESSSN